MAKSFNAMMQARFKKITTDYGKINQYVHETAMLILNHAKEHGDCSTAQGLVNAMPRSARKLALVSWFSKFSPIVVKDDDNWVAKMHKEDTKLFVPFDIEGAAETPWFDLADTMGAEKVYNLDDILKIGPAADAKRIRQRIEKGEVEPAAVAAAEAYADYLEGIKIPSFRSIVANDKTAPAPVEVETETPAEAMAKAA